MEKVKEKKLHFKDGLDSLKLGAQEEPHEGDKKFYRAKFSRNLQPSHQSRNIL
jgi:hypothetical protein